MRKDLNSGDGELAMSSGKPTVRTRLAATRLAKLSPGYVSTGTPAHKASSAVA